MMNMTRCIDRSSKRIRQALGFVTALGLGGLTVMGAGEGAECLKRVCPGRWGATFARLLFLGRYDRDNGAL